MIFVAMLDHSTTRVRVHSSSETGRAGKSDHQGGKYSILHSDGDLTKYLNAMVDGYSGFHPLDIMPKSTMATARLWASALADARNLLPDAIFLTGIPIDLLRNSKVSEEELVDVVKSVIEQVGKDRLILTTTHRLYPGGHSEISKQDKRNQRIRTIDFSFTFLGWASSIGRESYRIFAFADSVI